MAKRDLFKGWLEQSVPLPAMLLCNTAVNTAVQVSESTSDLARCSNVVLGTLPACLLLTERLLREEQRNTVAAAGTGGCVDALPTPHKVAAEGPAAEGPRYGYVAH
jgi:hypothetical protein